MERIMTSGLCLAKTARIYNLRSFINSGFRGHTYRAIFLNHLKPVSAKTGADVIARYIFTTSSMAANGTASNGNPPSSNAGENLKLGLVDTFLNLEKLDKHLYRSKHLMPGLPQSQRVYGGQVIGQSLVAAGKTVPAEYHAHSLHCYFIKSGDKDIPIVYHIDPVRDGRSFATRFVKAVQDGEAIFSCQISFHKEEPTSIEHQMLMPKVPKPEELQDACVILQRACIGAGLSEERRALLKERLRQIPQTFDVRPVDPEVFLRLKATQPRYLLWVKSKSPVGKEVRLHHCVAAFISDASMVTTALVPHLPAGFRVGMAVSLDHSIWFHRHQFNVEEWMLYETESTVATAGRAFIHGRLWTRDGVLVLSTAQEALIRAKMPTGGGASTCSSSSGTTTDSGKLV